NQSIDDSDAPLARDLRVLIRERLVVGDTDRQVMAYVTARYGEFVRLQPTLSPKNGLLWLAPVLFLLLGAGLVWRLTRRKIKNN
ncbi:MAG: cytochrome c-type biogenesis protein, partial [Parvibaculales bacterium]